MCLFACIYGVTIDKSSSLMWRTSCKASSNCFFKSSSCCRVFWAWISFINKCYYQFCTLGLLLLLMHIPHMNEVTDNPLTSSCLLDSLKDFSNVSMRCILARSVSSWPCSSLTCSSLSGSACCGSPPSEATCLWVSTTCSLSIKMFWLYLQT